MNKDSEKLLKECTSGCKMAVESIDQMKDYEHDTKLIGLLNEYKTKHEELDKEGAQLLCKMGECAKEPGVMASTFAKVTADVKLMMKDDNHQIAKMIMDGCNMGIQSIQKAMNECENAESEAKQVAQKLIRLEEDCMKDMKIFL